MTSKDEIQSFAQKAQKNDIDAFTVLVEHFQSPLLRYILRLSDISIEEGEEILQEVFLHAWRYINDFDTSFAFSTWIYRIAHQKTISYHRKEVTRGKEHKQVWNDEIMENVASSLDIEKQFLSEEIQKNVQKAISHLPENQKQVVILKYLEEKSYEEISDILQMPVGTAGSLASRGKATLKKFLLSYVS